MQLLRPPALPPPESAPPHPHPLPRHGPDGRLPVVRIKHPDYPPPADTLITIPAFDPLPSTSEPVARARRPADAGHGQEEDRRPRTDVDHEERFPDLEVLAGLHHGTVLTMCGIIADNAFDRAYLSHDREGLLKIQDTWAYDSILPPGEYWLQVPPLQRSAPDGATAQHGITRTHSGGREAEPLAEEARKPYPVVSCFADWRFPHGRLPSSWSRSHQPPPAPQDTSHSRAMATRLGALQPVASSCVATGYRAGIEIAHIVHAKLGSWFTENDMSRYNYPSPLQAAQIDQPSNRVPMRADLHALWDSAYLTILPKPVFVEAPSTRPPAASAVAQVTAPSAQYALALHVLATPPSQLELVPLYHNLALRLEGPGSEFTNNGAREFLFARLAWSIFPLLRSFLEKPRWVVMRGRHGQQSGTLAGTSSAAPGYEHAWSFPAPSSRNSCRKRSASQMSSARDSDRREDDRRNDDSDVEEFLPRKRQRRVLPTREAGEDPDRLGYVTTSRSAQMYVAELDDDAELPRGRSPGELSYGLDGDELPPPWDSNGSGGLEKDDEESQRLGHARRGRRRYRIESSSSPSWGPAPGLSFSSPPASDRGSGLSTCHHGEEPGGSPDAEGENGTGDSDLVLPPDSTATKSGGPGGVAKVAVEGDSI